MTESKVADLENERRKREVQAFLCEAKNRPPLQHDVRLNQKNVRIFTTGFGGQIASQDFVRILFLDGQKAGVQAALELSRDQWSEMRKQVDSHFDLLEQAKRLLPDK